MIAAAEDLDVEVIYKANLLTKLSCLFSPKFTQSVTGEGKALFIQFALRRGELVSLSIVKVQLNNEALATYYAEQAEEAGIVGNA